MHEYAFLGLHILDKAVAFGVVKEAHNTVSDSVIGYILLFRNPGKDVLRIDLDLLGRVGRRGRNIPMLIDVGHHVLKAFALAAIGFTVFRLFLFFFDLS